MARPRRIQKLISKFMQRMKDVHTAAERACEQLDEEARDDAMGFAAWQLAGAQAIAIRIERMGGRI